ncbi:hypothetical protein ACS0TY_034256 [Phlomoides rotata]
MPFLKHNTRSKSSNRKHIDIRLSSYLRKPTKRGGSLYYMSSLPNEALYEKEKNGVSVWSQPV